ncbi:MAG: adenylyltransferase/cytidyltransferase family protein [Chloroflexi bacterium]|nr:adenylyltransferase/cytidyltransferase family protein [Chloroflexota bacterium]
MKSNNCVKTANSKVKDLDELALIINSLRSDASIVLCHGVFDLMHIGHIRHLEEAKTFGDILVVTVTPDKYVNKGPHRPAFTEQLRAESIASLDCVDYVAINKWPTAVPTIKLIKPNIYAKGPDYKDPIHDFTGKIIEERSSVEDVNGKILFTDDITYSSSNLINKYIPVFSKEVTEYLSGFSKRYSLNELLDYLRNASSLKVLVIGEAIIDEYQYCEQMAKSNKEPILATRYVSTEKFAGGIMAVANHTANFCNSVTMLTMLGASGSQEEFIRSKMNSNIESKFIYKPDSPTIVKRRFIESYLMQKLFEVYEMNDDELDEEVEEILCRILEEQIPQHDVVIVVDYGHGMLTRRSIDILCKKSSFLTVNTQSNAGNRGFNTISKYPGADYVCLAYQEIALEERRRHGDIREMMVNVGNKLNCERIMVTRGKGGNVFYHQGEGFVEIPAFTDHVVDRMGAGDAVFALTSLCLAQKAPAEAVGFIGNAVGAQAVGIVGNRSAINPVSLYKHIESLLK